MRGYPRDVGSIVCYGLFGEDVAVVELHAVVVHQGDAREGGV